MKVKQPKLPCAEQASPLGSSLTFSDLQYFRIIFQLLYFYFLILI